VKGRRLLHARVASAHAVVLLPRPQLVAALVAHCGVRREFRGRRPMIGPRPTKGSVLPKRGLAAASRAPTPAPDTVASKRGRDASSGRSDSSPSSGCRKRKRKDRKEYAWMDSDDDGSKSSEEPLAKEVPLDEVTSLSQMARLAPGLRAKLRGGDVRPREMCALCRAAAKTKFFDGELFEELFAVLPKELRRGRFSREEMLDIICGLSGLNAYNAGVFDAACAALTPSVAGLPSADRERIKAALSAVKHDAGSAFMGELRGKKASDNRDLCELFVRGQCKMGPRCKLSHDMDKFEDATKNWKGVGGQDGKSQGYRQSADLFKADRCGALW